MGSGRRELSDIRQIEARLDTRYVSFGILESILAELLVLYVLEFVVQLVVLVGGDRVLPCGKDDSVLARCVMLVHSHEAVKDLGEFGGIRSDLRPVSDRSNVVGDLASAVVLLDQNVHIARGRAAPCLFLDAGKEISLFEFFLVIILTECPKQTCRLFKASGETCQRG